MESVKYPASVSREAEHIRVKSVVETLAGLESGGESVAGLAHDARNMVTALGLYCDLLEEPGVLAASCLHYGSELRLVAAASARLVEKLAAFENPEPAFGGGLRRQALADREPGPAVRAPRPIRWDPIPAEPIANLAEELLANRNLLAALAGPSIALTVEVEGGAAPVRLTGEDLTRVLVNLVKNASEAMPGGGRVALALRALPAKNGSRDWLSLTIEDNGPGIPLHAQNAIFEAGYTTRSSVGGSAIPAVRRGLGLSITRSIVEAAGGRARAASRTPCGARIEIELPVESPFLTH
jgi:signal transduction histidine kinase